MKMVIRASSTGDKSLDIFKERLESEAHNAGYEFISGTRYDGWRFVPREDPNLLPTIELSPEEDGQTVWFMPTMKFPTQIAHTDVEFYDSFEYYMDQFKKASRLCTYVMQHGYTPGMYEDE